MAKILTNPNQKIPKNPQKYCCKFCDYSTSNKKDFIKHEATLKHQVSHNPNQSYLKNPQISHDCICGKIYKHKSTLSAHKKKCNYINKDDNKQIAIFITESEMKIETELDNISKNSEDIIDILMSENKDFKNIILDLVKSNTELQKQMMEVCKNGVTNNTNINSNNKTFNLQFFLNEQCKDAMNIMDFVDTFQLQFSDFERIGEVGYVEGISRIIINKLNEMDIYKRPIHCSDAKREIMYVKDKDVWEKENATNSKMRLAIRHISKKNSDMIRPWLVKHPGALDSDHRLNDNYQMMIIEAMGGNSGTLEQCENKIIRKISKMVLIDKR